MQESAALNFISQWGYVGIFAGMLLEGLTIPFPGVTFVILGGALAAKLQLNYWLVASLAVLGYSLGTFLPYYVARLGGRQMLYKYGKYVFLTHKKLELAESWFERYGNWVVCLSRPFFFGNYVSYLAGLTKMNFSQFVVYTLLGTLPWCFLLIALGYYAGQAAFMLFQKYGFQAIIVACLIIIPLGVAAKAILNHYKLSLKNQKP
jgi:membrane protein DedA with SNARE-associated domain